MAMSFLEYIKDILFWRVDPFVFKTAEFYKRNFNKVRSTLSHVAYEIKKVKKGFINLKNDCLFVLGLKKKQVNIKYRGESYLEGQKVRQVKIDVIKFIPFSFFIIIPGAEILLPPFLVIFPNSIPSQFMSEEARSKKF
jgi:LETM1 and EF-hand domain-containing protein 1